MTEIKNRLNSIIEQIKLAQHSSQKAVNPVKLLAVSKTWSAEKLRQLAQAGQKRFGENYLQEALDKIKALSDLDLEWHFIGPIQSNKTRAIAESFDWVQSVDRLKIARRLSEQRPDNLPLLNICLQVNIDNEASKSGVAASELLSLATEVNNLDRLCLRGLMVIPAKTDNPAQQHAAFAEAYQLFTTLKEHYPSVDTLSMGMTGDMAVAIAEGSTMVRIGTALFGQRHVVDTR